MASTQRVYVNSNEFKPSKDLILVKTDTLKTEEVSTSGIVLSINKHNSVVDRPSSGTVIEKGSDVKDININDTIFWPDTDGINFEFDDGEFLLLKQISVIGTKK